jgi:uncharacterized protein (TIGR02246 family)
MLATDIAEVVDEVAAVFDRYEEALVANDLDTLTELFWDDGRVVRFGPEGSQYGAAAVEAHRRAQVRQTLPRTLRERRITTFGTDTASVTVEFIPHGHDVVGRQSQLWVRSAAGWRVVAAHVSWEGGRAPG